MVGVIAVVAIGIFIATRPGNDKGNGEAVNKTDGQEKPKTEPPKDITNSIGMKFVWIPPWEFHHG